MAKRGIKFEHSVGEVVLCFEPDPTKARVLYEAKILDSQVSKDRQGKKCAAYLVHFQGWNNSWDRLVAENYILKANEENKALMKRLTETAKKQKNRQRRRHIDRILKEANVKAPPQYESHSDSDSSTSEDDSQSDTDSQNSENGKKRIRRRQKQQPNRQESTQVTIDIPDILKARLEDDYTAVSIRGKLCNLPAKPSVVDVLERFMKTFCINYVCDPLERELLNGKDRDRHKIEKHLLKLPPENVFSLCKEMVDGLRILFDFTLPLVLLYASEQEQYETLMKNTRPEDLLAERLIEKHVAVSPEPKAKRGRPPGKHKVAEKEKEETEDPVLEMATRRHTRRSTVDTHFSEDQAAGSAVPAKRQKKMDGSHSPKISSSRSLRRRGIHEEPLTVKVEDNSDTEIEFSPIASTSTTFAAHDGTAWPQTAAASGDPVPSSSQQFISHKEDLTDSILRWQVLPLDVRRQPPVYPSQVYGVHHLLRLFVKLPELLNKMPFESHKLPILVKLCHHCLQYLVDHQPEYFS